MSSTEQTELKKLTAAPEEVTLSTGETVLVHPFKFKDFPKVLDTIGKYAGALTSEADIMSLASAMMLDEGEGIYDLMLRSLRNKEPQFLDDLEGDDGIAIMAAVIGVNTAFFKEKVLPKIEGLGKLINPQPTNEESESKELSPSPSQG